MQRRVSVVQRLFGQHVPDVLANVVGGQFIQFERRVLALKVAVVAFMVAQRPRLQAFILLGAEKQGEVIIERMVQGDRCGSQPFACCCCHGHMNLSPQNGCKKAAKVMAAVILIIYDNYKIWKSKRTRYLRIIWGKAVKLTGRIAQLFFITNVLNYGDD